MVRTTPTTTLDSPSAEAELSALGRRAQLPRCRRPAAQVVEHRATFPDHRRLTVSVKSIRYAFMAAALLTALHLIVYYPEIQSLKVVVNVAAIWIACIVFSVYWWRRVEALWRKSRR